MKLLLLCCGFLCASCATGYVAGYSQAEVFNKIAKRAVEDCENGSSVYIDIGEPLLGSYGGLVVGEFTCAEVKP